MVNFTIYNIPSGDLLKVTDPHLWHVIDKDGHRVQSYPQDTGQSVWRISSKASEE